MLTLLTCFHQVDLSNLLFEIINQLFNILKRARALGAEFLLEKYVPNGNNALAHY